MENENDSKIENIKRLSTLINLLAVALLCFSVLGFIVALIMNVGSGPYPKAFIIMPLTTFLLGIILPPVSYGVKMLKRKSLNMLLVILPIVLSVLVIMTLSLPHLILVFLALMIICIISSVYLWSQRKLFT